MKKKDGLTAESIVADLDLEGRIFVNNFQGMYPAEEVDGGRCCYCDSALAHDEFSADSNSAVDAIKLVELLPQGITVAAGRRVTFSFCSDHKGFGSKVFALAVQAGAFAVPMLQAAKEWWELLETNVAEEK